MSNPETSQAKDRGWEPIVPPGTEHLIPPREKWITPGEPFAYYLRWLWEWRIYLTTLADLKMTDRVFEIGCNHGRTMIALLDYLKSPGSYQGIDILEDQIAYAQQNVHGGGFDLRFDYIDVHNAHYNPKGQTPADEFVFPREDESVDVAYAASVFTHMLGPATKNYFKETGRVLSKGGRALYSCFVLDHFKGEGTAISPTYDFVHRVEGDEGTAVVRPDLVEAYTGFDLSVLTEWAEAAGLRVKKVIPGTWSTSFDHAVCEQDLLLLEKS